MFDSGIRDIRSLLSSFLGDPKSSGLDSQVQFCCPCCAERKGVESDGKYNLECNIEKGIYHCWVCGDTEHMSGRISGLIKKYGNKEILNEYYNIIKGIKESSLYSLYGGDSFNDVFVDDIREVLLPQYFRRINATDTQCREAYEYLIKRGLNDYFIHTFNLGYVGWSDEYMMRNRIIVPSYNEYGEINYWVGRDYTGKNKIKYKNPHIEKKDFVFNEQLVNWYDNITLVEGVFDHMVVPNSIPLLGKSIGSDYAVYKALVEKSRANVNIFLDDDAYDNALRMYKLLNKGVLKGRIRLITCPQGFDASSIYEKFGTRGILKVMQNATVIDEYDLTFV